MGRANSSTRHTCSADSGLYLTSVVGIDSVVGSSRNQCFSCVKHRVAHEAATLCKDTIFCTILELYSRQKYCKRVNSLVPANETYGIGSIDKLPRFAELDHAFFQVVQRAFHENLLFLVVRKQVIPKLLLGQNLGVSNDDDSKSETADAEVVVWKADLSPCNKVILVRQTVNSPCSSESDIQTTWVVEKADALVLIGSDTGQHDEVFFSSLERVDTCYLDVLQRFITELFPKCVRLRATRTLYRHLQLAIIFIIRKH